MRLLNKFIFLCSEIWKNISLSKKKLFYIYILLSVFIAIIDFISITSLMNIVSYASGNGITSKDKINLLINIKEYSDKDLFAYLSFLFLSITVISILFRYIHGLVNAKISHGVIYEFNQIIFKRLIYLNLLNNKYVNINSVTSNLSKIEDIRNIIIYGLTAISSALIGFGILVTLLFIDIKITFFSLLFFSIIYLSIILSFKKKMTKISKDISENIGLKVNILSSLLNNIRNVIIDNLQFTFLKRFSEYDLKITKGSIFLGIVSFVPSVIIINLLSIILVGYLFFLVSAGHNFLTDVGKIVAIAYGAQKLVPIFQQVFVAWSNYNGSEKLFIDVLEYLNKKSNEEVYDESKNNFNFSKSIKLIDVSFGYDDHTLFDNISLEIKKGDRICLKGESGVGKSTLTDIIIGFLQPQSGKVMFDDIDSKNISPNYIKSLISNVPQNIFISNKSILENIAPGLKIDAIDLNKINKIVKQVSIEEWINSLENGLNTILYENGKNLSGGQKQRIGIARSLYKDPEIIIFDEATSSLDSETEIKIIKTINNISTDITIIFITHDENFSANYNKSFKLIDRKLKKIY